MMPEKLFGFSRSQLAGLLIRLGLAFVFIYAAISATATPSNWVGYFPEWVRVLPTEELLKLFSIGEIVLATLLIMGWKTFYIAVITAILLIGITVSNLGALDITFRDIGLAVAALALALLS